MQANNTHVSSPSCVEGPVFKPASREDLMAAIEECLKVSDYECSRGAKGPIGKWDVSAVTDMSGLLCQLNVDNWECLAGADRFNGDISKWNVSRVTDMSNMFRNAKAFNGDISKWDVSRVTDMERMFHNVFAFNGDISKWDVSRVTGMKYMFCNAKAFNGDISKWDVSRVTNMMYMFDGAVSFSQTLCGAWRDSKADKINMFRGSNGTMCSSSCVLDVCTHVVGHDTHFGCDCYSMLG